VLFADSLRRFPVVPFVGPGHAVKRPVWTDDVVDGLFRVAGNPVAYGKTYNLSGGEPIAMADFARLILAHGGGPKRFVHLPVPVCRALALLLRLLLKNPPLTSSAIAGIINDADLDPALAAKDLGYRPIGVREGFARCFPLPSAKGEIR
jgi:NADH dehydrogenase